MHRNLFITLFLGLSCITFNESALAAYTVIDDDLMPTSATAAPETSPPAHYAIPFNKGESTLSTSAKSILGGLLYQMRGATIRIVGRPDAYNKSQDTTTLSAVDRATNIRSYLVSQGIPTNNINIDIENAADQHANSRITNVDLYIASPISKISAQSVQMAAQSIPNTQPATPKRQWVYETLNVPFCALKTEPGPVAQGILNEATRKLSRAKNITVQGRADKDSADMTTAISRSDYLRKWLLRIGADENQIKVESQSAYRPSGYNNCGYSNISFKALQTSEEALAAQQEQRGDDQQTVKPTVPANAVAIPTVQAQTDPDMIPMSTIRRAFTLSDVARLDKANTLKLLENIHMVRQTNPNQTDEQIIIDLIIRQTASLPNEAVKSTAAMPPTPTNTVQPAAVPMPAIIAATSTVRKESWVLDKNLTLRGNVDAWSKQAGWNPSVWDASNYYQITVTSTIEGDFPDILRQIADSTGLNICAKKRERYVRVTDPNVSCKN